MKSEFLKTALFVLTAIVLVGAVNLIEPEAATPGILSDEGEDLFPQFQEVTDVKAIEVIAYDEEQATAEPLKVELRNDQWIMPSHADYPAEAADRLDSTAGALLGLKKDRFVSDRVEDHGQYGVIDPFDNEVASLAGRGKRVTLRNEQGDVLADLILGKKDAEHEGYRYVRPPGQKRVYSVKTEADPSARFEDWVEGNLLRLASSRVRKVTLNNYSIDESVGRVTSMDRVDLTKNGNTWSSEGSRKVTSANAAALVSALASIRIVGARPKPKPVAEQLRDGQIEMTLESMMSFRQRGFFLTPAGRLLSNEGEITIDTDNGLVYILRFGEIVEQSAEDSEPPRYMFVTVSHKPELQEKYGGSSGGERTARFLNRRFADWYYIISGADFAKTRAR